jgi:hypothetical protein
MIARAKTRLRRIFARAFIRYQPTNLKQGLLRTVRGKVRFARETYLSHTVNEKIVALTKKFPNNACLYSYEYS